MAESKQPKGQEEESSSVTLKLNLVLELKRKTKRTYVGFVLVVISIPPIVIFSNLWW
ncbi:hypothetical protein [Natronospirillum operosum]|uniref:hypothetical protein n=1 Tax=Natronospirillum operosum TaxID=2759953 RepID=UPI001436AE46|nr:hypothetical protein [Natronospirillum operosum]